MDEKKLRKLAEIIRTRRELTVRAFYRNQTPEYRRDKEEGRKIATEFRAQDNILIAAIDDFTVEDMVVLECMLKYAAVSMVTAKEKESEDGRVL